MALIQELQEIGLNKNEARIYAYLLENGASTPPQIAKGTGITRTNGYHILRSLEEKGLLHEHMKGKRRSWSARDPQALLLSLERKKEEIENILPDLRALHSEQINKPRVRFYAGVDEVQQIYWETLSAERIIGFGSTRQVSELIPDVYRRDLKELAKRHIAFEDILTHASGEKGVPEMERVLGALYRVKLLPKRYKDVPVDVLVWNDHVALVNLQKPAFGTVLANRSLADTFRTLFDVLWEAL